MVVDSPNSRSWLPDSRRGARPVNDAQYDSKTYTCGWCKRQHISMNPDGTLETHYQLGTVSTECRGQETYNMSGRTR